MQLSFCVLISFSIISSRFIHAIASDKISFIFQGRIIFYSMYIPYFVYTFTQPQTLVISIFWLLWIVLYEHRHATLSKMLLSILLVISPEVALFTCSSISTFLSTLHAVFHTGTPFYITRDSAQGFHFLYTLANTNYFLVFGSRHPDVCEVTCFELLS